MSVREYWDTVYVTKAPTQVSWYRPHLDRSLEFAKAAKIDRAGAIIDVGGGASTLVDDLLDRGYSNVTVLDVSGAALRVARVRLGNRAARVHWICGDVTEACLPERAYDLWHDRAVFHFLRDPAARARYVEAVRRSLKPGGHLVVATFGPRGPEKCSGLEVLHFTPEGLEAEFGAGFEGLSTETELHRTPSGSEQEFTYLFCRRR